MRMKLQSGHQQKTGILKVYQVILASKKPKMNGNDCIALYIYWALSLLKKKKLFYLKLIMSIQNNIPFQRITLNISYLSRTEHLTNVDNKTTMPMHSLKVTTSVSLVTNCINWRALNAGSFNEFYCTWN